MTLSLFGDVVLLLQVLGVFAAAHALMHTRTPQGAIGWVLGLLLLPALTLVPYLFLGASRFRGYLKRHRGAAPRERLACPSDDDEGRYAALVTMLGRPFRPGHRLRLLVDGEAAFEAIFAAVAEARHTLLVQFFIFKDDGLGRRMQQALLERAAAGVRVCVLYDGVGSHDLPHRYVETLRAGGVAIHPFATNRLRNRFQLNFRNHRKIVVVDGVRAFVGGLNVGDEYLGLKPPLAPWRDTHMELAGPAAADLQQLFADDWEWITGAPPPLHPEPAPDGGARVLVVASGPADPQETGSLFVTAAINAARRRIWLATPYFVPDHSVRAALLLAVFRGVDVRVLIPSRPDHRTVFAASTLHAHYALRGGVRVFRYQPGFTHQKVLLVDDDCAAVGSLNLDSRSFRLNFEASALVLDRAFAQQVEAMLERDFVQSREVDAREYLDAPYLRRVAMHVARLFDPIL
ncbi:cardiolipin synthase [Rhodanobacter sp. DHB23]|uniref:cardiolipin synthase n=1 Tax=Rhodanobacter sp. DHB23 TaxID=2775923 RepID=UPI001785984D|nr:cardiolipin synthase [Rhodanobacter sp. DHB23]MBD8873354.1 cardiolipin synthase [Rhodanobacter sp. DHB23]